MPLPPNSRPLPRSWMLAMPALALTFACVAGDAPEARPLSPSGQIRVNQLGFLPGATKLAVVETDTARVFTVVDARNGRAVLHGELQPATKWPPADRTAAIADVSALSKAGHYRIEVDGLPPSDVFLVSTDAYGGLADAALKGFYFIRASTALDAKHAGRYARAAGHPDTAIEVHASAASASRPAGTVISSPGGWYDAGDYNKYVVNSGISTYELLAALEQFPAFFRKRDIGIPESGDAVPDILDEARWNLQWLLSMQDPDDGGVYHKLTTLKFDGPMMPERDVAKRYVVQKTTAATLDFAAVMAVASRLHAGHEKQFPGVSARMRAAAEAAWRWAEANPAVTYRQPPDVVTGAYGDRKLDDEFTWAAAELFLLTGDARYLQQFTQRATTAEVPSWSDVGGLAWISLAQSLQRLPQDLRTRVEQQVDALAARLAAQWRASPWKVAMQPADFVWGSNAVVLNQAVMLLQGYRINGKREYLDAAQSQLDYILGRNPLGVSFVTGQGQRTPLHIHHRPSQADGIDAPVPGLMSGGPNPGQQDAKDCGNVKYASKLPALSWLDQECSYASNEIAINWNAPLVYVASAIQASRVSANDRKKP
jgi:endoglucanase